MKAYSNWQLPVYQVIGPRLRIHWNQGTQEISEMDGEETRTEHYATEAVVNKNCTRQEFIQAVEELGGPAESLADEWFNESSNS